MSRTWGSDLRPMDGAQPFPKVASPAASGAGGVRAARRVLRMKRGREGEDKGQRGAERQAETEPASAAEATEPETLSSHGVYGPDENSLLDGLADRLRETEHEVELAPRRPMGRARAAAAYRDQSATPQVLEVPDLDELAAPFRHDGQDEAA